MQNSAAGTQPERENFADELERHVAQRTAELSATNAKLSAELAQQKQTEEILTDRAREGRLIWESIPGMVALLSPNGEPEVANRQLLEYFGQTVEELKQWGTNGTVHPEDVPHAIDVFVRSIPAVTPYEIVQRSRRFDGVYRWIHSSGFPICDTKGRIVRWCVLLTDIDDRKRAEAQLAGEKRLLEMVASGCALTEVLTALCKFVETTSGDCKCGVYLIDWSGPKFHVGAAPSLPATFNDPLEGLAVIPTAGPCAAAALNKTQVISTDLDSDPQWQESLIRPLALAHGLRSQWSTPIFSRDGEVLGTFAIFQDHPSSPTQFQQDLIAQVAHIASIAIERALADEGLRSSERNLSLTINTIPTFISVSRPDGTVLSVNQAALDYHGITLQDVQKEDFRTRFFHPDDGERVREERKEALKRPLQFEYEQRALGKDGKYRWFLVRCNPLLDDQGRIDRWYATAFDIEDRKRAEALLAGEKRLLEMVAGGNTLTSILDTLCLLVEETASGCICGILLLDTSGTSLELAIGPSLPASYNEAILSWPVNLDAGPCGRAACLKEQVIVADVASDLQWDEYGWRPLALSHGLRACWSTPILSSENAVLGTFALYSREPGGPTPQLQNVIGQMTHLAAVAIERKLALEKLQANQELLDLAQKSAGAMAFDWYVQQEKNYWSPEQEALFGLAPGTFDGTYKTWKQMMYAPDWPIVADAIKHAHETGKVTAEYRVVWPDGSLHWLSTNGRMFFDEGGEPLRMVGFTSDVTRQKLVEEELRRSEAFLAQAQQVSRTGSFSWRVATDEITWSDELYRIYEFDPRITITLDVIRARVHPEDLTLYEKMVEQARNGAEDFEWQYRLLMPNQSIKYMQAVARATRDTNGQLEYIAAVQDVTARRLSDEALDKARSELAHVARVMSLGALTASIAHEVNQPLSGIITNASTCMRMLDAEPPNVDGARETAKRTIRDGRRAADVITRLRALFTNKGAATELVDLNEATSEVIALSRTALERNRVIARTELADELPLVRGDRVQLQQVIINLLRNGSDAMSTVDDRSRDLLFKTEVDEGNYVRLSVQDAGTGFELETLERLFETFYTTKDDGMGIGLSVSRSIIENHHGRLWATPNDGPGVTFSFSIPCGHRRLT